jgi:hypothetical protein
MPCAICSTLKSIPQHCFLPTTRDMASTTTRTFSRFHPCSWSATFPQRGRSVRSLLEILRRGRPGKRFAFGKTPPRIDTLKGYLLALLVAVLRK